MTVNEEQRTAQVVAKIN